MDLLRQILLRLPAPRVAEIAPALLPEVVKYLNRGKMSSEMVDRYIEALRPYSPSPEMLLLYLEGLMAPGVTEFIPIHMSINRAAFLRDKKNYLNLAGLDPTRRAQDGYEADVTLLPDLSLIADVPEIQAAMLATDHSGIGEMEVEDIQDPELIRWTRGLVRYYSERFATTLGGERRPNAVWTSGYIHAIPSRHREQYNRGYVIGYLTREMQNYPDPFVDSRDLNELLSNSGYDYLVDCMKAGYFPRNIFSYPMDRLITSALENIQPKFIRRYLSETRQLLASIDILIRIESQIRYSIVERAEEMLALLEPDLLPDSEYLLSLRILTGRRIDPNLVPDLPAGVQYSQYVYPLSLMAGVAHPQITKDMFVKYPGLDTQRDRYSSILYDLVSYAGAVAESGSADIGQEKLIRLYSLGKLLEAFPPEKISSMWVRMYKKAIRTDPQRDFMEKYERILKILRS